MTEPRAVPVAYAIALAEIATVHHQLVVAASLEPELAELGANILDKLHHDLPLGAVAKADLQAAVQTVPLLDNERILAAWKVLEAYPSPENEIVE